MPAAGATRTPVSSDADAEVALDALLELQARDTAINRLSHRRDTMPERASLASVELEFATLNDRLLGVKTRRAEFAREEQRFDDEVSSLEEKATEVERRMYSGEITSPRELQAMQADVDQLRRHRRSLEDRELDAMERREALDAEVAELQARTESLRTDAGQLAETLAGAQSVIDDDLDVERSARDEMAVRVGSELLADYERCRVHARGIGAARLVGTTCQGCHLSIPSVEAERIRKSPPGTVAHCDNCGCILVP